MISVIQLARWLITNILLWQRAWPLTNNNSHISFRLGIMITDWPDAIRTNRNYLQNAEKLMAFPFRTFWNQIVHFAEIWKHTERKREPVLIYHIVEPIWRICILTYSFRFVESRWQKELLKSQCHHKFGYKRKL